MLSVSMHNNHKVATHYDAGIWQTPQEKSGQKDSPETEGSAGAADYRVLPPVVGSRYSVVSYYPPATGYGLLASVVGNR